MAQVLEEEFQVGMSFFCLSDLDAASVVRRLRGSHPLSGRTENGEKVFARAVVGCRGSGNYAGANFQRGGGMSDMSQ